MRTLFALALAFAVPTLLAGCSSGEAPAPPTGVASMLIVHKSPTCGCCTKWMDHVAGEGFRTEVRSQQDIAAVQKGLGVPDGLYSCHVAEVDGYLIVGHVPAADIRRLLAEKPKARGLSVPGMPIGSPGMEHEHHQQAYNTVLFQADGSTSVYARH